jgi:hypothetical protein
LQFLQVLDLQDCHRLAELPQSCSRLGSLHTLQIGGTGIATAEADEARLFESLVGLFRHGCVDSSSRPGSKQQGREEVQQRIQHILQLQETKQQQQQQQQQRQSSWQLQEVVLCCVGVQRNTVLFAAAAASGLLVCMVALRAARRQQSS